MLEHQSLVVSDYYELLALHRCLLEAKFTNEPNDLDIAGSPIVAQLFRRTVDCLTELEVKRRGEKGRDIWQKWLCLSPERREWKVAVQRAKEDTGWHAFSQKEKLEFSRDLLSPFLIDDSLIKLFIAHVDEGP